MKLVSVRTDKEYHVLCKELGLKPGTDAIYVPFEPKTKRAQALDGRIAVDESDLIGEFFDHERAVLLAKPQPEARQLTKSEAKRVEIEKEAKAPDAPSA